MRVDFRTALAGSSRSLWRSRLSKFIVFTSAAMATAIPLGATGVTQFSVTFAPSQTINHQSLTLTVTPANGAFSAVTIRPNNGGVQFSFSESVPGPILFADLEFIAPNGAALVPGVYPGASDFEFAPPDAPIFEFGLSGEEQDSANEAFTILQLAYSTGGAVQSFGATFEIFDARTGAVDISGEADYNFNTSLAVPEPASIGLLLSCVAAILCFRRSGSLDKHLHRRF